MEEELVVKKTPAYLKIIICLFFLSIIILAIFIFPKPFPFDEKIIIVEKGDSITSVGRKLKLEGVIYSSLPFSILARIKSKHIIDGPYLFKKSENLFSVVSRISKGDYGIERVKVTFPEGFTVAQISARLKASMLAFDEKKFLDGAEMLEGYLYPETYFFNPNQTEEEIIKILTKTFEEKNPEINTLQSDKKSDVVILASIVEREVIKNNEKLIVAEIFAKRLRIGMALQADSTLAYERGKTSAQLTLDDLKIDTKYNTYTRKGLPPRPISNPGKESLDASYEALINPVDTPYLYFLTDKDGGVHYAKTFNEHIANKNKYLR